MYIYLNYISKDFYSIYLLVLFACIFLFKISNSTKLIYLFNRFVYSITNFFPGINEEDKHISLLKSFSFFNIFLFLFVTSTISFTIDSFLNFKNLIDLGKVWFYIMFICVFRFLFINYIIGFRIDVNIDIVLNKIYIITINTAFFLFIINLINSYYYGVNSFFLKVATSFCLIIYLLAQFNNYLYILTRDKTKYIFYFILYLCAFKLAPWIWLYSIY